MKKVIEDLIKKTALQGMLVCSVILDCIVYTPLTKKTCQSYLNLNLHYRWNSPGLKISTILFSCILKISGLKSYLVNITDAQRDSWISSNFTEHVSYAYKVVIDMGTLNKKS